MTKKKSGHYGTETALCADFLEVVSREYGAEDRKRLPGDDEWTAYPETGGFDILLVRKTDGVQIGIEAKLALNADVVNQALPGWYQEGIEGPDYRAVLVPSYATGKLVTICGHLGVTVIRQHPTSQYNARPRFEPRLPADNDWLTERWHPWCPIRRCKLPDFVPDVAAGDSAPLKLTAWKIKAIKLMILLDERPVTRADIKALGLDASRWTDKFSGWLDPTPAGYVRSTRTPDLKMQHPRNWEEIAAKRPEWDPGKTGLALV